MDASRPASAARSASCFQRHVVCHVMSSGRLWSTGDDRLPTARPLDRRRTDPGWMFSDVIKTDGRLSATVAVDVGGYLCIDDIGAQTSHDIL